MKPNIFLLVLVVLFSFPSLNSYSAYPSSDTFGVGVVSRTWWYTYSGDSFQETDDSLFESSSLEWDSDGHCFIASNFTDSGSVVDISSYSSLSFWLKYEGLNSSLASIDTQLWVMPETNDNVFTDGYRYYIDKWTGVHTDEDGWYFHDVDISDLVVFGGFDGTDATKIVFRTEDPGSDDDYNYTLSGFHFWSNDSTHDVYVDLGLNYQYDSYHFSDLNYSGDITDGLEAHWRFEDNAYDIYGGYDGVAIGSPSYTTGQIDNAVELDGASYFNVTSSINNEVALSLSTWIYLDINNDYNEIYESQVGSDRFSVFIRNDGCLDCIAGGSGELSLPNAEGEILQTGQWYHIVITFNLSHLFGYINGSYDKNDTDTATPITGSDIDCIGARYEGIDNILDGKLDDLRIYDRVLSQSEIDLLYAKRDNDYFNSFTLQNNDISVSRINGTVRQANQLDSLGVNINDSVVDGLLAHYRLDGDATDSTGVYDGTNDGVAFSSAYGVYTEGGFFNKTETDNISHANLLDVMPDALMFSFWFSPLVTYDSGASDDEYFVYKSNIINDDRLMFGLDSGTGKIRFLTEEGGNGNKAVYSNSGSWTGGTWYYICGQWDPINGMRLFVDGVLQTDVDASATTLMGDGTHTDFVIGKHEQSGSDFLNGYLDDVRVYNRIVTNDEISALYINKTTHSYVTDGFWNITVENDIRMKKVLINGTESYEMLLSGQNIIAGCDLEGFYLFMPDLSVNTYHITMGDIQVATSTSNSTFTITNSISGANLSVTISESESEISVSPITNSTLDTMSFVISVSPSQYYDSTQNLTVTVNNNNDGSSFSIYINFNSSTPDWCYLSNNYLGNVQVDTLSAPNYFNICKTDDGPNNLTFTGIDNLDGMYTLHNNSFPYTIDAGLYNSMLFWFSVTPPQYEDSNVSFNVGNPDIEGANWLIDETYGSITQDEGYLMHMSSPPALGVTQLVDFWDVQVDTNHYDTINVTNFGTVNNFSLTGDFFTSNSTYFTIESPKIYVEMENGDLSDDDDSTYVSTTGYYEIMNISDMLQITNITLYVKVHTPVQFAIEVKLYDGVDYVSGTTLQWDNTDVLDTKTRNINVDYLGSDLDDFRIHITTNVDEIFESYIIINGHNSETTIGVMDSELLNITFFTTSYIDLNEINEFVFNVSNTYGNIETNTTITKGMSTRPGFTFFNSSEHGDCQVDTENNLSFTLYLTDFSCPNNISFLDYTINSSEFDIYFNVSTINASQNVSYNYYYHPSNYADVLEYGMHTFIVDETYGAIDNESVMINHSGKSSAPTYTIQYINYTDLYLGNILLDQDYSMLFRALLSESNINNISFVSGGDNETSYNYFTTQEINLDYFELNFTVTPEAAVGVYLVDELLYVADGTTGLLIYNVSDPVNIVQLGNYDSNGWMRGVYVLGDYVYVADGAAGVKILNCTNLSNIILLDSYDTGYALDVFVRDNVLFVFDDDVGLVTLNVSNLSNIILLDSWGYTPSFALKFDVQGNYAYLSGSLFCALDISNVSDITPVGNYSMDTGAFSSVFVSDNYAYCSHDVYGYIIMNITDPMNLQIVSNNSSLSGQTHSVFLEGNLLYLGTTVASTGAIDVYNITNVSSPVFIETYPTSCLANYDLFVLNSTAYMVDGNILGGFSVVDTSPENYYRVNITLHSYFDNYTVDVWLNPNESYGNIDNSSSLVFTIGSPQPTLSNIILSYNNSSYSSHLPQDNISYFFEANNTNLNSIQIKSYIWTLNNNVKHVNSNFSTQTLAQNEYFNTSSIIELVREIEGFASVHSCTVLIQFYGAPGSSQENNNIFNLSIFPNFSMVNFSYIYPILSSFPDCVINTQYSDTWTLYNNFGSGGIDFDVITRTDINAFNVTQYLNIDNITNSGHVVNLINLYQLTFYATSHQAEFFINLNASNTVDLLITLNENSYYTQTISITGGTSYRTYKIYIDTLNINQNNSLTLELSGSSGLSLYIQNASYHPNIHISKFDWATADFVSINTGMAIDIIMSELLMRYETPRFYEYEDNLTIESENNNEWDIYYYPSVYTDAYLSTAINFVLLDNTTRRYLDNFTMIIRCECPRRVVIESNMNDLDITLYYGEENTFNIEFTNTGTISASVLLVNSSIDFITPNYQGKVLNVNSSINISFSTNSLLISDYIDEFLTLTIIMALTNNGSFSDEMTIYISSRASYSLEYPSSTTIIIDRKQDETKQAYFTIKNTGYVEGSFSVILIDPEDELDHNYLDVETIFTIDYISGSNYYDLTITVTGSEVIQNETWVLEIYLDNELVDTYTIIVNTEEDELNSWESMVWWWILGFILLGVGIYGYTKIKKKNNEANTKIEAANEKNIEEAYKVASGDKEEAEFIDTSKKERNVTLRKIGIVSVFVIIAIIILIPIFYYMNGSAEPVWKPISDSV